MGTKDKKEASPKDVLKPISKSQMRFEKKQKKQQEKDFKRYGLTPEDMKDKSAHSNEEVKKGFPSLRKCLRYSRDYKGYLFGVVVCSLFYIALSVFAPYVTQHLIDAIGQNNNLALWLAFTIMLVWVIRRVVFYVWDILAETMLAKITRKLRLDLFDAVSSTKSKKFDQVNSGTIVSRINNDASQIANVLLDILNYASDILVGIGFIVYVFIVNVWMGLVVVGTSALLFLSGLLFLRYNYKIRKRQKILSDKRVGFTNEVVRGMRDIKNLNIRKNVRGKFLENINYSLRASMDQSIYGNFFRQFNWICFAVAEFVCTAFGIWLLSIGQMTIGGILMIIMYYGKISQMIGAYQAIQDGVRNASISAERVVEILDNQTYPKEKFGNKKIKKPQGKIEFKNVVFGYDENTPVLKGLSLKIEPRQSIAFVGKSGQGKSTLLSLIPRLYDAQSGEVLIDDVNITKLSEDGLRDIVTVVPQNPYIFNTSIKENLKFVKPDLTDEEMMEVCKKAQIHDFIMTKQNGYDSLLGENGLILSGGQHQRLAIARALLKQGKIILFDEATSALDNENQSKIQKVIEDLTAEHTVLIVAHRLSTVVNCDQICMLENGEIIAKGTHQQLMKTCKPYQKLYRIEQKASKLSKEQEENPV